MRPHPLLPLALVLLTACGGGEAEAPPAATGGGEEAAAGEPPAEPAAPPASVGTVSFTVDGAAKTFEHLPDDENFYLRLSSTIHAQPAPGSIETLRLVFLSIDLREPTYPADLPAPRERAESVSVAQAMASIGFSYTNPSGEEWAGPGEVHVESFGDDGVIRGSFGRVTLPHTDGERPDLSLADGAFSARIASP